MSRSFFPFFNPSQPASSAATLGRQRFTRRAVALCSVALAAAAVGAGCGPGATVAQEGLTLPEARAGFETVLVPQPASERQAIPWPPNKYFQVVSYKAPVGQLKAYLTPAPQDKKKHPAIIWLHGGDSNALEVMWGPQDEENDQSAAAYRESGIVMMLPSLRGGNQNPGMREGFFREVDDVLAAREYLATLPYVDPARIYLGGHSTGATLALLVAESSPDFRAVFALGAVDDVASYASNSSLLPFNTNDKQEVRLRSPGYWLESVESPLFVVEGSDGNIDSLRAMREKTKNPNISFVEVPGLNHFNVVAPANRAIAAKILENVEPDGDIELTADDILDAREAH